MANNKKDEITTTEEDLTVTMEIGDDLNGK